MSRIETISARLADIVDELDAVSAVALEENGEITDAGKQQIAALNAEFDRLKDEREMLEKVQARKDEISASRLNPSVITELESPLEAQAMKFPVAIKSERVVNFATPEDAYISGMYFAYLAGDQKAGEFLAHQEVGDDGKGGFTVPKPLSNTLVNLLESYGVARASCRRIVMTAMTQDVPKLTTHATVYYPAEGGPITDSTLGFEQINLVAKKIAALVKMTTEIEEDSIISMMDTAISSIAYSMAVAEDNNLFNGVAGGVNAEGIKGNALIADVDVADIASLELKDLTAVTVASGKTIVGENEEWYMNKSLYNGPVRDLVNAVGGATRAEIEGQQRPMLLGYPVNFVSAMAGAGATTGGSLLAAFGDFQMACYFGDRRSPTFKILDQLYAETDMVGVVATERIDLQVANPEVLGKLTITG